MADLKSIFEAFKEQPIAVYTSRGTFAGIVAEAGTDCIVLKNCRHTSIVIGPTRMNLPGTTPNREITMSPIVSDVIIPTASIDFFCQPLWIWNALSLKNKENENGRPQSTI